LRIEIGIELISDGQHTEMRIAGLRRDSTYIARARVKYANVGRPAHTKSELVSRALEDRFITLAELNNA
jgi:hypothetical protein